MVAWKQVSLFQVITHYLIAGLVVLLISSCGASKKLPRNKPFVYKTTIYLNSPLTGLPKAELISKLENQLDDSIKTRYVSYAGVRVLQNPPGFDSSNIARSRIFLKALLTSIGYFYPQIRDSFYVVKKGDQQRVHINFFVTPGKQTKVESVTYQLTTPALQEIATEPQTKPVIKANDPYSIGAIAAERDRLVSQFHQNGYYKIGPDDVYALVDTVVAALIDPTLDPFEQIRLLDSLKKKSENPTIKIVFKQKPPSDSNQVKKFYIGNVTILPDQSLVQDSVLIYKDSTVKPYQFRFLSNRFKLGFMNRYVSLIPGKQYNETDYYKTINTFNRLGAWQSADVALTERYDSVPLLDAEIRLYPSLKRNLKVDLEASRNIADYLTTSQFFGLGLNFALTNRNAFRQSIQTNTNARFGVEFGSSFIQTLQTNLSHSINFPRLIVPFKISDKIQKKIANERTILNINGSYTIRKDIYNVSSINSGFGYEWSSKRFNWQLIPINVEYTRLDGKDSLNKLIQQIPSLRYAFNDGFVIGTIASMNTTWIKGKRRSNFKVRIEESGALFGFIKNLERNNLFRFIKTDIEYKHLISYNRSALAFRGFFGYGYVYGKKGDQPETNLPFFKAYFAGGPYSMRAWQVRRLGPGSTLLYDTSGTRANDRFGNMQLEANMEYRFDLTTVAGIKVKSALFVDMGNIWSNEFKDANLTDKIPEASFQFSRLYKDLAIGGGTSLRLDFDYFLIRFDWAYKLKDPRWVAINNGWFHDLRIANGQFQLGINYPF